MVFFFNGKVQMINTSYRILSYIDEHSISMAAEIEAKNHDLNKWKSTVALDPWLIGGELAPLSRLVNFLIRLIILNNLYFYLNLD